MRSSPVVVPGILSHHGAQVPYAEDQHPVGDLGPGGEHEPFGIGVCPGASGRDLDRFDTSAGQDRVERRAELSGPVTNQEPEGHCCIERSGDHETVNFPADVH